MRSAWLLGLCLLFTACDGCSEAPIEDDAGPVAADAAALDARADASGGGGGDAADAGIVDAGGGDDSGSAIDDSGSTSEGDTGTEDAAAVDPDAGRGDAAPTDGGPFIDFNRLTWRTVNTIDPRATVFGDPQTIAPRNLRGLALSPDRRYLYAGYLNGAPEDAEIRRIDLTASGTSAYDARVRGIGAKALAVDDVGRVYVAGETAVTVLTSTLGGPLFDFPCTSRCEGVAVTREAGATIVYVTDRNLGTLERRRLEETNGVITRAIVEGLGANGALSIDPAGSLRNVGVDLVGRIWIVAFATNRVYRVSPDGSGLTSTLVQQPFDLDFDGPYVIVTHNLARNVSRVERDTMTVVPPVVAPPWMTLGLDPLGQNNFGAITGLVVIPEDGFYVAHESGSSQPYVDPVSGETIRNADPILWAED